MSDAAQATTTPTPVTTTAPVANADAAQTAPTSTPAEAPKPAANDDQEKRLAKSFAALSRQEKAIRAKETEWKSERAQLQAQAEELKALRDAFGKDPAAALEKLGLTYEEVTRRVLSGGKPSAEHEAASVRRELDEFKRAQAEQAQSYAQRRAEAAQHQFLGEIKTLVDSDDRFELTRANEATQDVYDVVDEHYRRTGEVLSTETAAELVEKYYEQRAEKLLSAKKMKAKLAPPQSEPTQSHSSAQRVSSEQPKTLSNNLAAASPTRESKRLTESERLEAAARILAGKR
jgi:hypothetical protein